METLLHLGLSNAVMATVLALVAGAAALVLRRRPALAHAIWLLVLVKLVTPPLVYLPAPWTSDRPAVSPPARDDTRAVVDQPIDGDPVVLRVVAPADLEEDPQEEALPPVMLAPPLGPEFNVAVKAPLDDKPALPSEATSSDVVRASPDWFLVAGVAWAAGSLSWFVLAAVRVVRFGRLLRLAPLAPSALHERTRRLAQRLGLQHMPMVRLVPGRLSPMLWSAGGTPQLLVPAELLGQVRDDQLDTILLHELAHLRRRDHWVRALEFLTLGLYWWHPAVWWARRELREAEEQCCDAWVVSVLSGSRRSYAEALVETLDFLSQAVPVTPPLASGIGHVSDLKRRLTMILSGTTPRALSWRGGLTMLGLTALLPLLPAWVRAEPPKEATKPEVYFFNKKIEVAEAADEKTEAEVRKLKVELEKRRAEIAEIEARLKALSAKPNFKVEVIKGEPAKGERVIVLHDVIRGMPGARATTIILEAIPGQPGTYRLRTLPEEPEGGPRIKIIGPEPGAAPKVIAIPPGATPKTAPVPPVPPVPPLPGVKPPIAWVPVAPDKRMQDLEKRLDELMREIEQLRKDLKAPRPTPKSEPKPLPKPPEDEAKRFLELRLQQAELLELREALRLKAEAAAKAAADRERQKAEEALRELRKKN